MKRFLFFLLLSLIFLSCKKEKDLHTGSQKEPIEITTKKPKYRVNFYDSLISESLKFVNRERAYFTYKTLVNDSANIQWFIKRTLDSKMLNAEEKKRLKQEIVFPDFDTTLSAKNKALIKKLHKNKLKENSVEISYLFSYPYLISKDRVLIFKSNHHIGHPNEKWIQEVDTMKNISGEQRKRFKRPAVKGGNEAFIIFEKENGKWKRAQAKVLLWY